MTHWSLRYSGMPHSIKKVITWCPPRSSHLCWKSFPLMQGWSLVVSCEGVGISQTLCFCCLHQHIVWHSRRSRSWTKPFQMPKILQDSTLLQPGMCIAAQIWFVQNVRCSLPHSMQNSAQTVFQIFQLPSLKFYWNAKVVHMVKSIKSFEKTYKVKLRLLSSGMPHSLTDM